MIDLQRDKPYSLRIRLVLYVVLPLLVISACASYVSLSSLELQVEEKLQDEVALIARAIRLPVSRALEEQREAELQSALESAFRIHRVYGAYVYDEQGNEVLSFGHQDPAPPKGELAQVAAAGEQQGTYGSVAGREVYSYFVPLPDSGKRITGLLQVTRRKTEFDATINRLRLQTLAALLVAATLMTGVIVYGHERAVGRQLNRLMASMARVGRGDRTHRAAADGPQEVRTLANALNAMLDGMSRAERELEARRAAEARLHARLRQTEKFAAIGRLAAGVAHELGGPLTVIEGKAQRGLRSFDRSSERAAQTAGRPGHLKSALEDIRAEVARMERTVRQLLDFGRRTAGRRRTIMANHLAQASIGAFKNEAELAGVRVSMRETAPSVALDGDPLRLQQALGNLLRNAIQASAGGRVELAVEESGTEVAFSVDDDGPGISPEIRDRLFEPFVTTKAHGAGTGLGLAVAHSVVDDHGGRIELGPSPLGGTRFRMIFPRHDAARASEEEP